MSNQYRATSKAAEAAYDSGVFDHEFSPADERDVLASGLLELVPRPYRILVNNYEAGEQGDIFEAAFLVELEAALISGGVIERTRRDAAPTVEAESGDQPAPPAEPATTTPTKRGK